MKKRILGLGIASCLALGAVVSTNVLAESSDKKAKVATTENHPKNIIFLIGDGMGVSYTSAYRYFKEEGNHKIAPSTAFDHYLVGQQATHPEDPEENVTDSAAAATAMSAGVKTYNNAIAVDNDLSETPTVLERAKELGKSTGLVATSEITHATPAAFGSHDESRKNMKEIADDYFDNLTDNQQTVDVLLGGGLDYFQRDDRDLVKEFEKSGYSYVANKEELLKDDNEKVLGLFAPEGLPKMIDRDKETPSLAEMTTEAIERLNKNNDGFFLMVEGSQIDWAGHSNDVVGAMSEMQDFEAAFEAAIQFAEKDGNTLVVTTADHSTGGFSIGANDEYNWLTEPLHAAKRTPDFMANEILNGASAKEVLEKYIDFELTKEELATVTKVEKSKELEEIAGPIRKIFDARSNTGWTTGGHTGEDVNVYAYGPKSEEFAGRIDNTDQAKLIFNLLEGKDGKAKINDKDIPKN